MRRINVFASALLSALGAAAFAPLTASAAPPCPECWYPYRACVRSATSQAEDQACRDAYFECLQEYCPDQFLTRLLPAGRKDEAVLASRVVRQPLIARAGVR